MEDAKLLSWIETGQLVAALLVAVGVAGEFVGSFWAKPIRERMEQAQALRMKKLEADGIEANKASAIANQAAAEANARGAQLEKDAAHARLETERLKESMAWRRLTTHQHDQIVAALRGKITKRVWVECSDADHEASQFHADIYKALEDAGVQVQWYSGWERIFGLQLTHPSSPDSQLLKKTFESIGIQFEDRPKPAMPSTGDDVELIVGSKHPRFFTTGNAPMSPK